MTNSNRTSPPAYLLKLLEDTTGKETVSWHMPDCGLSPAFRFSVMLEDKNKVFVKAATDETTAYWLRNEYLALSTLRGKFMPNIIAWIDIPDIHPVLITQDLSDAYWPASHQGVTWRKGDFELLLDAVQMLSSIEAPPDLPAMKNWGTGIWPSIAENPCPFLQLGLCSEAWFKRSIDALILAESKTDVTGNFLVHGDIRSDNICIEGSQVIFVDWSHAGRGNKHHDLGNLLPTLHLEGGPAPYLVMPEGGVVAASGAAALTQRLLADQSMPEWLKKVFIKLIAIDLEWASQCLGIDLPDEIK
ncbi:phosphotransferase [Pseudobacter ginsenosidimutans]|uniref:Phosphotransferase family enzyme n=1 Tax=Pseudobacter ginsenosidimutans TaxID=661488 RepID=A0A4V2F140_9BACT|nr:phosphotransferase [Pseudobacter ginsenosidimutans]RZS72301.1 phosphotransferase family enzyme [Pseudobacter ginsenosidimutans]